MTKEQIEQAAIDWRGRSESAYTTDAFIAGAKWAIEQMQRKVEAEMEGGELLAYNCEKRARQEIIDKACNYLREHIDEKLVIYHEHSWCSLEEFISKFREFMLNENKE